MEIIKLVDLLLLLLIIYFIFIHEYLLARREFKCLRCGKCCKFIVNLSKEDIEKIKKTGYKDFLNKDNILKKKNGYCIFLTLDNGITSCKLENSAKPFVCKTFPYKKGIFGKKYDLRCSSCWKLN